MSIPPALPSELNDRLTAAERSAAERAAAERVAAEKGAAERGAAERDAAERRLRAYEQHAALSAEAERAHNAQRYGGIEKRFNGFASAEAMQVRKRVFWRHFLPIPAHGRF